MGDVDRRRGRSLGAVDVTGGSPTVGEVGVDPNSAAKPPRQSMLERRVFFSSLFDVAAGGSSPVTWRVVEAVKVDVWRDGLPAVDLRKVFGRRRLP